LGCFEQLATQRVNPNDEGINVKFFKLKAGAINTTQEKGPGSDEKNWGSNTQDKTNAVTKDASAAAHTKSPATDSAVLVAAVKTWMFGKISSRLHFERVVPWMTRFGIAETNHQRYYRIGTNCLLIAGDCIGPFVPLLMLLIGAVLYWVALDWHWIMGVPGLTFSILGVLLHRHKATGPTLLHATRSVGNPAAGKNNQQKQ
jgi:hypothetical protein